MNIERLSRNRLARAHFAVLPQQNVPVTRPGELQSRGLVHFSASKHGNHPVIVGRKHGPDPFALGLCSSPVTRPALLVYSGFMAYS